MSQHRKIDPRVAEAIKGMGVDIGLKEKKERSERPKYSPAVASLLRESMGVTVSTEDISGHVSEENSPLDAAGSAPLAHSSNGGANSNSQNGAGTDTGRKGNGGKPQVSLKDHAGGGQTLDDFSAALGKVSESIRDIETLAQTLRRRGNDISQHKAVLGEYIKDIDSQLEPFRQLVK